MANGLYQSLEFGRQWIWKLQTLQKIQFFLWKCAHNSIGVNGCLSARGMEVDSRCPRCLKETETIIHALRNCNLVKPVWNELGAVGFDRDFFDSDLENWMATNGNSGLAGGGGVIRDWTGRWIVGFPRKIGIATSLMAEVWAIWDGLMLCVDQNLVMVEIELDMRNYLARKGTDQDQSFIVLDNPPEDMTAIVESDLTGVGVARRCAELGLVP
ncbi:uncharacterized protein LOC136069594 [Quercus suber]|uniref:uncharacterized protein LOC136069594 n=1 Tax=Quercus suber TaxID=58331 RepID=UPI0032DE4594